MSYTGRTYSSIFYDYFRSIRVATRMQLPKGNRRKPTAHRHSQSNDPTGISAKGLAPTGISSGNGYLVVGFLAADGVAAIGRRVSP